MMSGTAGNENGRFVFHACLYDEKYKTEHITCNPTNADSSAVVTSLQFLAPRLLAYSFVLEITMRISSSRKSRLQNFNLLHFSLNALLPLARSDITANIFPSLVIPSLCNSHISLSTMPSATWYLLRHCARSNILPTVDVEGKSVMLIVLPKTHLATVLIGLEHLFVGPSNSPDNSIAHFSMSKV